MASGISWGKGIIGLILLPLGDNYRKNVSFRGEEGSIGVLCYTPANIDGKASRGETTLKNFSSDCHVLP